MSCLLLSVILAPVAIAQQTAADSTALVMVTEMPKPIGGLSGIQRKVKYPKHIRKLGISGKVFVIFVVDENGDPTEVEIAKPLYPELDASAKSAIKKTKFTPAKNKYGDPVRMKMSIPITFGRP